MVEDPTLFEHAGVEVSLVAETQGVSAGHARRRSDARALQGRIRGLVRALEPGPAQRQCGRLQVVFAFR
jgi:hypothetical protein